MGTRGLRGQSARRGVRRGLGRLSVGAAVFSACGARSRDVVAPPDAGRSDSGPCSEPDLDGDGHRSEQCAGDDCDDGDPEAHPGAAEAAGRDLDCNGVVGVDGDGDGHLTPETGGDDCDDGDAERHPGATEDRRWEAETVDFIADHDAHGPTPGLALDSDGFAHIGYHQVAGPRDVTVRHASNETGEWVIEVVDFGNDVDIVRDDAGTDHLFYGHDSGLRHAQNEGGVWTFETAVDSAGVGPNAVLGPDGVFHIATATSSGLTHAFGTWGDWTLETAGSTVGGLPTIAVDTSGIVHMSVPIGGILYYVTNASGEWESVIATMATGAEHDLCFDYGQPYYGADDGSIAIAADGTPMIAYSGYNLCDILVGLATLGESGWTTERVANGGGAGNLVVGPDGVWHLFYSPGGGELRYATKAPGDSSWTGDVPVATGGSSWGTDMVLDPVSGAPHIVYVRDPGFDLVYLRPIDGPRDLDCDGRPW
jgi:hypothetical protein